MTEKPVGKYVLGAVVRPSVGRAYVRCGTCKRQVFTDTDPRRNTILVLAYVLRANLMKHMEEEHP